MKIVLFANTDWYLYNFRLSLAQEIRRSGHEVVLVSPDGPYLQALEALGFACLRAPMSRLSLNPLREVALVYWLFRRLRAERADLVHGFTIKCAVYGALAGRMARVARVGAIAGMGFVFTSTRVKARLLRPLVKAVIRLALGGRKARVILQNPDDFASFERAGFGGIARLIPGSGVDCRRFVPPKHDVSAHPFRIVVACRLLWDKGLQELVDAARLLRGDGRQFEILLAGEPDPGNPASVPLDILSQWDAEGLVIRLGHVKDMIALFQSADVVVLPSYREGLPKSLIEAAACGRAMITTDVPGCREVVRDGIEGLLVPARDAKALAQAIAALQDQPALIRAFGAAARRKAEEQFDEQLVIGQTLATYQDLTGGWLRDGDARAAVAAQGLPH